MITTQIKVQRHGKKQDEQRTVRHGTYKKTRTSQTKNKLKHLQCELPQKPGMISVLRMGKHHL